MNKIRARNRESYDFQDGLKSKGKTVSYYLDSIADLKALDATKLKDKEVVEVLGYYTPGDNGGGVFYWDNLSVVADNSGTVIIPNTPTATGRWIRNTTDTVNVKWFGAKGDGITDDTVTVQAAIDSVCQIGTWGAGAVYFPAGTYRVTQTLDLTNNRLVGTKARDGLKVYGDGLASVIVGETGYDHAIVDVTGTQFLCLTNIKFESGTTNKSTVGIYQGISSILPQTQNQRFEQVYVFMHDDMSSNGGKGTIALWNFGAEENTYDTCYFIANIAGVFTTEVGSPIRAYPYPLQAQLSSHSLGMSTLSGECFVVSLNRRTAPLWLLGVNSFRCDNVYISNIGTGGSNDYAIKFYGTSTGVEYNGTIEQLGTLHNLDTVASSRFNIVFGDLANSSAPVIKLERGGTGIILNSDFQIHNNAPSAQTRDLFSVVPVSTEEQVSCYAQNSTFRTNLPVGRTGLHENLVWNTNTRNIEISGIGYKYVIDNGMHKLSFKDYLIGYTGDVTELVKVKMPTALASSSGGAVFIKVEGILGTNTYYDGSKSAGYLESKIGIVTNQNGVRTYGTASTSWIGVTNVNAGGNNITDISVTATDAIVTTNTAINVSPTITGVNGERAFFTGTIEMLWSGWASCAPTLLLSGQSNP